MPNRKIFKKRPDLFDSRFTRPTAQKHRDEAFLVSTGLVQSCMLDGLVLAQATEQNFFLFENDEVTFFVSLELAWLEKDNRKSLKLKNSQPRASATRPRVVEI